MTTVKRTPIFKLPLFKPCISLIAACALRELIKHIEAVIFLGDMDTQDGDYKRIIYRPHEKRED